MPTTASDSDDAAAAIGPLPPAAAPPPRKKPRRAPLAAHAQHLARLPAAPAYARSYMHRDTVFSVHATARDFIITTSVDGVVKFWKKVMGGIEFVKQFKAHPPGSLVAAAASNDGRAFATAGDIDMAIKCFDVDAFDMINMFKIGFAPLALCWVHPQRSRASGGAADQAWLAVSDRDAPHIRVYDARSNGAQPLWIVHHASLHRHPVHLMRYHATLGYVLSADTDGMLEVWEPTPEAAEAGCPVPASLPWSVKSETDLFAFKKAKAVPDTLEFSPDESLFVTTSTRTDRLIRVFRATTCKLLRVYDESLSVLEHMQQAGTAAVSLDPGDFGRRLAAERDLPQAKLSAQANAVVDESGHFLLYATALGVKVLNLHSNKVERVLGAHETPRFLHLALYQGAPQRRAAPNLALAASDNPTVRQAEELDPTLFCTAHKKNRFYLFTPSVSTVEGDVAQAERDVINEKPTREEQAQAATTTSEPAAALGTTAIIHTTKGDITCELYPQYVPKTVENFVTLATRGYYNNNVFHRVIKNFMIQTGDPTGSGSQGESMWGGEFADEFHPMLKHDKPYTLSMANAGPNTNGSQFFITTVPTPWLDNKHSVFGRATAGIDTIHAIEGLRTNRLDRPHAEVKIVNIDIR